MLQKGTSEKDNSQNRKFQLQRPLSVAICEHAVYRLYAFSSTADFRMAAQKVNGKWCDIAANGNTGPCRCDVMASNKTISDIRPYWPTILKSTIAANLALQIR